MLIAKWWMDADRSRFVGQRLPVPTNEPTWTKEGTGAASSGGSPRVTATVKSDV